MVITWHGEGCFRFQNGETTLLVDPFDSSLGLSVPRFRPDILIKTLTAWPSDQKELNADYAIIGAGEYDIEGIKIKGFELINESSSKFFKTVYSLNWDQIAIGLLGHLSLEQLPQNAKDEFEELDILIGPAGGEPFIEQEKMIKLVKELNPKIFIPSFYKVPNLKRKAKSIDDFVDEFNGDVKRNEQKLVFKKKDLSEIKKTNVVCLTI
jgi:L-ascorbate metabolism protein UlaG (beta-lactamase superfamily)